MRGFFVCFSASASFALSGVLFGVGAVSLKRSPSRHHVMFASAPLIFAAQQATEGVVWLTSDGTAHATVHRLAVVAFLGFALIVWPMWLPFSLLLIERSPARSKALAGLFWLGVAAAATAVVLLTRYQPVAVITGHSIRYNRAGHTTGWLEALVLLAYFSPTILPLFVSTAPLARAIGIALTLSLVLTALIERTALTSLWCFFAAILSGLICVAIGRSEFAKAGPPLAEFTLSSEAT
jgi:hypothetical protein